MDLSKLSDADLMALKSGDLTKVSDAGLMALKGDVAPVSQPQQPAQSGDFLRRGMRTMAPLLTAVAENPRAAFGALFETPATIASGMAAGTVGPLAGVASTLTSGKYGTPEGIRIGQQTAQDVSGQIQYRPRTEEANAITQALGRLVNDSGIVAVAPLTGEMNALARAAAPANQAIGDLVKGAGKQGYNRLDQMLTPKPTEIPGMGSANVRDTTLRIQRAQALPVPITLTKGQATRTFNDQRFERETAKMAEGEPLRQRFAEQNAAVPENFDAWIHQTGAEKTTLRSVGESVVNPIIAKKAEVKARINAAYNEARTAGQMAEQVDVAPLRAYVEQNRSAAKNAPILSSIEDELNRLANKQGTISINDMEELRKMTGRLSQPGTPNSVYGSDAIKMIDDLTRDKGGPLYQQARRMYENYANEFNNKSAISNLLKNKPNTKDRAIAFEDVFDRSILSGSLDDVRALRRTLQTAGEPGTQAWKELQGQTLRHIKDKMLENSARDVNGNPIVSAAKLDVIVKNLDADGKLDFIFGKQGGAQIRDINDMAKDILTSPPGSVNSSNTATVLAAMFDTVATGLAAPMTGGFPLPVATGLKFGRDKLKQRALTNKMNESLNYTGNP
jgi:hypothetical protein